jgi:hypothetical protein
VEENIYTTSKQKPKTVATPKSNRTQPPFLWYPAKRHIHIKIENSIQATKRYFYGNYLNQR